ncbi:MAG TPA: PDC sensor domain-containing protein [Gammaproteobacteria bacterium]|nr:PDC sensor domain-containing protein [Gammaproteobacteria bacterium]
MSTDPIQQTQRRHLNKLLAEPMSRLSTSCAAVWADSASVDQLLAEFLHHLPSCRLLYSLDAAGVQCSANIFPEGLQDRFRGQDLSRRPFWLQGADGTSIGLSPVYLDQHERIPCITAIQPVQQAGQLLGYVAADFALHDLPLAAPEPSPVKDWTQYRGDPAIRETLFLQHRTPSRLEGAMDGVLEVVETLFGEGGIFHAKIHFSSSRVTLWPTADPFRYRIHTLEEILDPDLFLSYPPVTEAPCPGSGRDAVSSVLERFKALRQMDDTLYLRSASLNICNNLVGLNFSCDGTHYLDVSAFLEKGLALWLGAAESPDQP